MALVGRVERIEPCARPADGPRMARRACGRASLPQRRNIPSSPVSTTCAPAAAGRIISRSFTSGFPPTGLSSEAHDRLDHARKRFSERFPGTEILIHVDPEGQTDRETLLPQDITEQARLTSIPFFQVDAFAERPLTGNPAAVMPLDRWLDDATMQAIAAENNLSETAFTVPSERDDADYDLRWFTPAAEVELCGHATLAAGHVLIHSEPVRFATRSGVLMVSRRGDLLELDLPAARADGSSRARAQRARWVCRIRRPGSLKAATTQRSSRSQTRAAVRAVKPDFAALAKIRRMAVVTARGDSEDIASRVFVPYARNRRGPGHRLRARGARALLGRAARPRPSSPRSRRAQATGVLHCRLDGDRVILGGHCHTVIVGSSSSVIANFSLRAASQPRTRQRGYVQCLFAILTRLAHRDASERKLARPARRRCAGAHTAVLRRRRPLARAGHSALPGNIPPCCVDHLRSAGRRSSRPPAQRRLRRLHFRGGRLAAPLDPNGTAARRRVSLVATCPPPRTRAKRSLGGSASPASTSPFGIIHAPTSLLRQNGPPGLISRTSVSTRALEIGGHPR